MQVNSIYLYAISGKCQWKMKTLSLDGRLSSILETAGSQRARLPTYNVCDSEGVCSLSTEDGPSVLVYDVGGSHISAAVCFRQDYRLGTVVRANQPTEGSSAVFVDVLHSIGVKACEGIDGVQGAELAMPGPFDYEKGISWMKHKMPYLYGVNVSEALAGSFGWKASQVRFLNDAAAYLLGEVGAGAARGVKRVVCFTLGTGVGSGFAVDGKVVTQGKGVPPGGEIWNVPYEGGIVEDKISTRAIKGAYMESKGQEREVASIAHYAIGGDPEATAVFQKFGRDLGVAIKALLKDFAPDVVVLGGGIARSAHLFFAATQAELEGTGIELRIAGLGDDAPLAGAGVAWFAETK
jgi:glucokinase